MLKRNLCCLCWIQIAAIKSIQGTREKQDVIKIDFVIENKCYFYAFLKKIFCNGYFYKFPR